MATDLLPEMQRRETPRYAKHRSDRHNFLRGVWWKLGLFAIGAIAVVSCAAAMIHGASSSRNTGPRLTHTITRGNLLVTVIEQGTLESSDNTEIKCRVRGQNTVIWVVEGGTVVEAGDELVKLDVLVIEEAINERSKYAHWSRSAAERSNADVTVAGLAIQEYLEGRYRSQLMTLEKDLAIAESTLRKAQNVSSHAQMLSERGFVPRLEVDRKRFDVTRAELDVGLKQTEIDVLRDFTKKMELETLKGNLEADKARHEANKERAFADAHRRDRALVELDLCVIRAERSGLVIYPSAAAWKNAPDIEEGASVHQDQILLLMPDLSKMQIKVGIHESIIGRVKPGMETKVTLPDKTLNAKVSSVASVTSPAGWWTGNVVKYETIIQLPAAEGLKPGMSAEVEVIIAKYIDVLRIPVAAVLETSDGDFCWVKTASGAEKHSLQLGDTNDVFIVVEEGLKEGDEVVLNPLAFIQEAQTDVLKPLDRAKSRKPSSEASTQSTPLEPDSTKGQATWMGQLKP
jgi:multidrug resistance efflux pump